MIRERTMRGNQERARKGLFSGGRTPFSYTYAEGKLIPENSQAEIIREIFHMYDSGMSIRHIAMRPRDLQRPSWSGKPWSDSSAKHILKNETYCGRAYYGKRKREGRLMKQTEMDARIAIMVPALISRELFERVSGGSDSHQQRPPAFGDLPAGGLIHCACGRWMTGQCAHSHRSYRSSGRDTLRNPMKGCRHGVGSIKLDDIAWQAIVHSLTDADFLHSALAQHEQGLQ